MISSIAKTGLEKLEASECEGDYKDAVKYLVMTLIKEGKALERQRDQWREVAGKLADALKPYKEEHSRVMREVSEIGYSEFNVMASMVCNTIDALAAYERLSKEGK